MHARVHIYTQGKILKTVLGIYIGKTHESQPTFTLYMRKLNTQQSWVLLCSIPTVGLPETYFVFVMNQITGKCS